MMNTLCEKSEACRCPRAATSHFCPAESGGPLSILRQSICACRSPTRDQIAGRPRSALRLPCAKSVAVTTVALRTGEFWKRLLRQGEAVRSGSPEQGVCQPPTVVLDNSGTDRALCAVLSRPSPPKRGGISPQPPSAGFPPDLPEAAPYFS